MIRSYIKLKNTSHRMGKRGLVIGYSIIVLLFTMTSILHDAFLLLQKSQPKLSTGILIGGVLVFTYTLITIAILHHKRYNKQYYYLPIFFLITYLLSFGLGLVLRNIIRNHLQVFIAISIALATIQLVLSIYTLRIMTSDKEMI